MALPDRHLTPGHWFTTATKATVCVSGYTTTVRHVTESQRHRIFAAYGIPYAQHSKYELDHLVALELGGDNSDKNLWPEPYAGTGARIKDKLENELHNLVCSGRLTLATAEKTIAGNWYKAYRTYGGSSTVVNPTRTTAPKPAPTTTHPKPAPTTTPASAIPPDPGNSKNCSDFSTYAEAKAWFDKYYPYYGDVARLDADHDGIPCESLPGAP